MRVLFCIAESMMLPVHNSISPWVQIRGTLANKGQQVENTFVKFIGTEHFMRCVPVQKKCLEKQGKKPVADKEY